MSDHDRHAAANAEQVQLLREALNEGQTQPAEAPAPAGVLGNWLG